MSGEKHKKKRREEAGRCSKDERRQALTDWGGRNWQPGSDVNSEDEKRENSRHQMALAQRTENSRKS
jgi:hypothetical protein